MLIIILLLLLILTLHYFCNNNLIESLEKDGSYCLKEDPEIILAKTSSTDDPLILAKTNTANISTLLSQLSSLKRNTNSSLEAQSNKINTLRNQIKKNEDQLNINKTKMINVSDEIRDVSYKVSSGEFGDDLQDVTSNLDKDGNIPSGTLPTIKGL